MTMDELTAELEQAHRDNATLIEDCDYFSKRVNELKDENAEIRQTNAQQNGQLLQLFGDLGVASFGDARTKINELRQHQDGTTKRELREKLKRLKMESAERGVVLCDILEALGIDAGQYTPMEARRVAIGAIELLKDWQLPDGVTWPVDADGVRIEVGDELVERAVYTEHATISGFALVPITESLFIMQPDSWHHVVPEPADSWAKLEDDACCTPQYYVEKVLGVAHDDVPFHGVNHEFAHDLIRRAKALAGVGDD